MSKWASLASAHWARYTPRIYSELENVDLVGVYDVDERRAQKLAKKYKTNAYTSLDELSEAVEAASVAVPTHLHREVAGGLLEKGTSLAR